MSQADLVVANQGFPAFRADLNAQLQALGSCQSGDTAPATTYANMLWYDSANNILKIRNEANSAWINLLTLDQTGNTLQSVAGLVIGTNVQAYDAELGAIAGLSTNGIISRTGAGTAASRTITGTTNVITVTNGDGAAGNPTLTVGSLVARTDTNQSFTVAQRGAISALTDGATITPNFNSANNFSVTLAGNRTLANPTNITAGQSGVIVITQDATGSRTLAYGSYFKFPSGTAPTLTTTASAVDVLAYYVESTTRITARLINDVK
jgi:hypothetical protein